AMIVVVCLFFFSSRRRHTRSKRDWSSDVCSSDLAGLDGEADQAVGDALAEFMKQSIFGERIAHGLLGLAIQAGLFTRATQAYAKIGRASCRERVQSPVRATLTTKKIMNAYQHTSI